MRVVASMWEDGGCEVVVARRKEEKEVVMEEERGRGEIEVMM
jgi:hypothetical protein